MGGVRVWRPVAFGDDQRLAIVAADDGIEQIRFDGTVAAEIPRDDDFPLLRRAAEQLHAYFRNELTAFDLPLVFRGSEFQRSVWTALLQIPYGETRSYLQIAECIGMPKAVRAVGAANGENPIPIVVPCHRVIGANGKLTGFGGGLPMKRFLLDLESAQLGLTLTGM